MVYLRTTNYPFAGPDDAVYIPNNHHVNQGLTLQSIRWAFSFYSGNWDPLVWISHMADCQVYGLNPSGHHLTNVLFHIVNSVLLFLLLMRMTRSTWRSAFVAALFALHPLHVESVAHVSERKDMLSTMFWLLTMWAYVWYADKPRAGRYVVVALLLMLGLMCKPMLVSIPIVLMMMDYWPLKRGQEGLRRLIVEKIPLFAIAAASCAVTFAAQQVGGAIRTYDTYSMGVRVANAFVSYITYIEKMLWPRNLIFLYPHPGTTIPVWLTVICTSVFILLTYFSIKAARRAAYITVGWLWYVITLLPVIGLVQIGGHAIADRFTYVPLIGLFIAIAWCVPAILSRLAGPSKTWILAIPAAVIIIALMVSTWFQVGYWRSTTALCVHAYDATGGNNTIRCWLADALLSDGKRDEALALLNSAQQDKPGMTRVYNALGWIYGNEGRLDQAISEYRNALKINPDLPEAHNGFGTILAKQGKIDEALAEFRRALKTEPYYPEAHYNIGLALAAKGDIDGAISEIKTCLRIFSEQAEPQCRLGMLLLQRGKTDEAISHLTEATEIDPGFAEAHYLLGITLQQQGRLDEAIGYLRNAARIKSNWGAAHNSLAMALYARGDYAEAKQEAQTAKQCGFPVDAEFVKELEGKL